MDKVLATRCPHCHTQFRITPQQLALREGMVRCGACREIFNGQDDLSERDEEREAFSLTPPVATQEDPSDRMTLIDFGSLRGQPASATGPSMEEELDALSRAIADLQSKPWTQPSASAQSEFAADAEREPEVETEPGFVQDARQRERSSRIWKILLWLGIPLLLLAIVAQLGYYFRNDIAARSPEAARYLRAACKRIGCTIKLPAQIELLSLQSSQLDSVADQPNQLILIALLRNQSDTLQTWPSLDLQLKNQEGQPVVRKVFLPGLYLTASEIAKGMPARSEREIRIPFELTGDPAAGFDLTIFYH